MPVSKLVAQKIGESDGRTVWKLTQELTYENGVIKVVVPEGFQCDFCSIPRLPIIWLACSDLGQEAGTVHDYLYREGAEITEGIVTRTPTRKEADDIFLTILGEEGVSWWKRKAMYHAVRYCAGQHWQKRKVMEPFIKQEVWV